ncbi:MAG: hypothetical protein F4X02_09305 [Chloroflexi bacterium]|nr:hypothetical protein [Chloroflexota bacterium]
MRLGWSVLCRGYTEHGDGSLSLERVFADARLEVSVAEPPPTQVSLSPAIILISHWYPETDLDLNRYPATLRIVAPEDNRILEEWQFSIDFLLADFRLAIFNIDELTFVGDGLYEFHIEVLEYGEWIIMSRNSIYVSKTVL